MSNILQSKLSTSFSNTSGWTAIRQNGKPTSYIREMSPLKVEPPVDSNVVILQEDGAQVVMAIPFLLDRIEYLESHLVEIPVGQNCKKESRIIGCKCILSGVELRTNQLSIDKREMLLVFMEGSSCYEVALNKDGGLTLSKR